MTGEVFRGWQQKVADAWFKDPLEQIIDEMTDKNWEIDPSSNREDCRPASVGKNHLYDILQEKKPDLWEQFDPKTIKACIFVAMESIGYHSQSRRKKCFWRDGV